MAKKAKKATPKRSSSGGTPKLPNAVAMRGHPDWTAWLNGYAAHLGMPATVLLDLAVRERAERDGYTAPPSRTHGGEA